MESTAPDPNEPSQAPGTRQGIWIRRLFRRDLLLPLGLAMGTRGAILLAALLGHGLLGPVHPDPFLLHGGAPHQEPLVNLFQRWDSYWLLHVAREGYTYFGPQPQIGIVPLPEPGRETNVTVFPLYPAILALAAQLGADPAMAGLGISLLAYLAAMVLLFRWTTELWGEPAAARAVLYLSLYPTGFIYNAIYSEALFLLLSFQTLRQAHQGHGTASGLYGLFACLTRLHGVLLLPCQALALMRPAWTRGGPDAIRQSILALLVSSLGIVGFFAYLGQLTGDRLVYFTAQAGWQKSLVSPLSGLAGLLAPGLLRDPERLLMLGAAALFAGLSAAAYRRLPPALFLYGVLGLIMPLCASNLVGLPRYLMVVFPAFMTLAVLGKRPQVHALVLAGFSLLHGPVLLAWSRWRISL